MLRGQKTNIMIEAMNQGYEKVVDYIIGEGFSNIRACFKKNNHLEIDNEVPLFNVEFFLVHLKN